MEVRNTVQEVVIKTIPKKKKCKKAKWLSEEALQIAESKRQRRKGKIFMWYTNWIILFTKKLHATSMSLCWYVSGTALGKKNTQTETLPNNLNAFIKMYYFLHLLTLEYEVCTTYYDKRVCAKPVICMWIMKNILGWEVNSPHAIKPTILVLLVFNQKK